MFTIFHCGKFGVNFGNSDLDNSNWLKSHTHERKVSADLKISFWHLLMNFENPKKSDF